LGTDGNPSQLKSVVDRYNELRIRVEMKKLLVQHHELPKTIASICCDHFASDQNDHSDLSLITRAQMRRLRRNREGAAYTETDAERDDEKQLQEYLAAQKKLLEEQERQRNGYRGARHRSKGGYMAPMMNPPDDVKVASPTDSSSLNSDCKTNYLLVNTINNNNLTNSVSAISLVNCTELLTPPPVLPPNVAASIAATHIDIPRMIATATATSMSGGNDDNDPKVPQVGTSDDVVLTVRSELVATPSSSSSSSSSTTTTSSTIPIAITNDSDRKENDGSTTMIVSAAEVASSSTDSSIVSDSVASTVLSTSASGSDDAKPTMNDNENGTIPGLVSSVTTLHFDPSNKPPLDHNAPPS
jgi:hypothetical protein